MSRRETRSGGASVATEVAKFALAGAVALALVGLGTLVAARRIGERQAITEVRSTAITKSESITVDLVDGLLAGDAAALASVDDIARVAILDSDLVRVKIWGPDGTILYSDASELIGSTYTLGDEEQESLESGAIEAEVSNLAKPENRFERPFDRLLEVYLPIYTPAGGVVLFEAYFRYAEVSRAGNDLWRSFAPIGVGALVLLQLVQIPLAWSLARRLRDRQRERVELLTRAVDASEVERRRIAADLHDGVVQDLAGVAYSLSGAARTRADDPEGAALFESSAEHVRGSIKALRSLLVELYPPNLDEQGLETALTDLLATAQARGVRTELRYEVASRPDADVERLLYRVAQEGIRNVVRHAAATSVTIEVAADRSSTSIVVVDDGVGIDPAVAAERRAQGHLGLRGLENLARESGGDLRVESGVNGRGTKLIMEVPNS